MTHEQKPQTGRVGSESPCLRWWSPSRWHMIKFPRDIFIVKQSKVSSWMKMLDSSSEGSNVCTTVHSMCIYCLIINVYISPSTNDFCWCNKGIIIVISNFFMERENRKKFTMTDKKNSPDRPVQCSCSCEGWWFQMIGCWWETFSGGKRQYLANVPIYQTYPLNFQWR